MTCEFIAVCGPSAVGKQSLLRGLVDDPQVCERLGICGDCQVFENGLPEKMPTAKAAVVWKWQYKWHDRIEKLRESFPECHHRAFWLWVPVEEHAIRLEAKYRDRKDGPASTDVAEVRRGWCDFHKFWQERAGKSQREPLIPEWVNASTWLREQPPEGDCWDLSCH